MANEFVTAVTARVRTRAPGPSGLRPTADGLWLSAVHGPWALCVHSTSVYVCAPSKQCQLRVHTVYVQRRPAPATRASTGLPSCKWPSTDHGLVMDRRALMGRGPVRGSPSPPRTCSWQGLQVKSCPLGEMGTSALRHTVQPSSDALKPSLIRRAVSTLVYATLLHPVQGLLPMTIHPP
jgi:hypothetical protein